MWSSFHGAFQRARQSPPNSLLKSPVGLDIGAKTPEEIAISIAGEIVAVKKGKLVFWNQ